MVNVPVNASGKHAVILARHCITNIKLYNKNVAIHDGITTNDQIMQIHK